MIYIEVPLYFSRVIIATPDDEEELQQYLEKLGGDMPTDSAEGYQAQTFMRVVGGVQHVLILLRDEDVGLGVRVHELLHAVTYILAHVGIPLTNDNDEAAAYLLQYLVEVTDEALED